MLFISLCTLLVVGLGAALVANWLNRRKRAGLESARAVARARFATASEGQVAEEVLRNIGIADSERDRGMRVLTVLSQTIGLPTSVPPADLTLANLFRIEVGPTRADGASPTPEYLEPFSYDLVENLLAIADKSLWNQRVATDAAFPSTEDELADLLMTMTVASFVRQFVPLARADD